MSTSVLTSQSAPADDTQQSFTPAFSFFLGRFPVPGGDRLSQVSLTQVQCLVVLCIFGVQAGNREGRTGDPLLMPHLLADGMARKTLRKTQLLSKTVETVLLAQIKTGLNPENHKIVLYVLVNIFNRKSSFFLEGIKKRLMKSILTTQCFYSLPFWVSQYLLRHITCVQEVTARCDARHDCIFSKQNSYTQQYIMKTSFFFFKCQKVLTANL